MRVGDLTFIVVELFYWVLLVRLWVLVRNLEIESSSYDLLPRDR